MDTLCITPELVAAWRSPPFQREKKVNAKVRAISREIATNGGVLPGVIHLGVLDGQTYLVDGQHRTAAFLMTGLPLGYCDVRTVTFKTMGEMGNEFVNVSSVLRRMGPDDLLRGMEGTAEGIGISYLRQRCPFIGYGNVRRGGNAQVMLSMSSALRSWFAARRETPSNGVGCARDLLDAFTLVEAEHAAVFYGLCFDAWGREAKARRLWLSLTTTICGWLYIRLVLGHGLSEFPKTKVIGEETFRNCLLALGADATFADWVFHRQLTERVRTAAYIRIK
jgi:hypothetical protein